MKKAICTVLAALMLFSCITVTGAGEKTGFTDVKASAWYAEAVGYVYENGLMNGVSEGSFDPNGPLTRAMFVTILGRMAGAEEKVTTAFSDVNAKTGKWYAGYVGWAVDNGIVTGYPDGTFGPMKSLTRQEMSSVISRYLKTTDITMPVDFDNQTPFGDAGKIAKWAKADVQMMKRAGLVKGNEKGDFDPGGVLSRAQAATIIQRLDTIIKDLTLGEPNRPDYSVGDFQLLGAERLYYCGTALYTNLQGFSVKTENGVSYLAEDPDDPVYIQGTSGSRLIGTRDLRLYAHGNPLTAEGTKYWEFDLRGVCIDPSVYPVVRFGYRSDSLDSVGVWNTIDAAKAEGESRVLEADFGSDGSDGWKYGIADLSGTFTSKTNQTILTLIFSGELELRYIAAFKDRASAEAFSADGYKKELEAYDGARAAVTKADGKTLQSLIGKVDAQRDKIQTSPNPDPEKCSGTVYYISPKNGNDKNDGLSPKTAWKSFSAQDKVTTKAGGMIIVHNPTVQPGDTVLIERGTVINVLTDETLYVLPGVTYSTYGEGEKPLFTHEIPLSSPAGTWEKTEYDNVWVLKDKYEIREDETRRAYQDIGNIRFIKDGIDGWGVKILSNWSMTNELRADADALKAYLEKGLFNGAMSPNYGPVFNGYESYVTSPRPVNDPGVLQHNLEYFHDFQNGKVYLYYDKGNPGEEFDEIHLSMQGTVIGDYRSENDMIDYGDYLITLQNLNFRYIGGCAAALENMLLKFDSCEFEWIGGCLQDGDIKYGNAYQNWGSCNGIMMKDCYFNQVYDASLTTQGNSGLMYNFFAEGNVTERTDLAFEFFNGSDGIKGALSNLFLKGNYFLYNGYGFCDIRTDRRSAFLYTSYSLKTNVEYKNIIFEDNLCIFSTEFGIVSTDVALGKTEGAILRNNTYVMDNENSYYGRMFYNLPDKTGTYQTYYLLTSKYMSYLQNLGVELGSEFYSAPAPTQETCPK